MTMIVAVHLEAVTALDVKEEEEAIATGVPRAVVVTMKMTAEAATDLHHALAVHPWMTTHHQEDVMKILTVATFHQIHMPTEVRLMIVLPQETILHEMVHMARIIAEDIDQVASFATRCVKDEMLL